ncbi:hypothetical protein DFH08DRAFT_819941 [Mycena albidolilacea]|uniref:Uncharacterized protein n=1 Tax=Mycena albidolilacea TaxID=1033008 RepID=A0AAD6ZDC3_9AGAR|nr:hypothetical protein DFH08DRAFT_819941 [Mycena albidolilacea]
MSSTEAMDTSEPEEDESGELEELEELEDVDNVSELPVLLAESLRRRSISVSLSLILDILLRLAQDTLKQELALRDVIHMRTQLDSRLNPTADVRGLRGSWICGESRIWFTVRGKVEAEICEGGSQLKPQLLPPLFKSWGQVEAQIGAEVGVGILTLKPPNTTTINLRTKDNWEGLVTDFLAKMKTKKDIQVNISVLPENYMIPLRAKNKKKAPAPTTGKGKRKLTVMELDNNDEEGKNDDDEDVEAGKKKALADLDAVYCTCVRCGPTVLCKIDRRGNHIHLSFPQRHAWAYVPWAKAPTFPPIPIQPHPQYPYFPPMPPMGYGLTGFPGYMPAPALTLSCQVICLMTYPLIIDFIETLITKVPQRQSLQEAGLNLHTLHYYGIDEITTLFGTDKFGNVLRGDAEYLLGQLRKEVKRLDKVVHRARL